MTKNTELIEAFRRGFFAASIGNDTGWAAREKAIQEYTASLPALPTPPIIFLDIDGVLNNGTDSERHKGEDDDRGYFYSEKRVEKLNTLIKCTGAKIVVSSTWRLGKTVEELQAMAKHIGVEGEVIGRTLDLRYEQPDSCRGTEIERWLRDNTDIIGDYYGYKNYVILDDDSDMLYHQRNNYVNCDPEIGLTDRGVFRSKAILLNQPCEDVWQEV